MQLDKQELEEVAEFDQDLNPRSDVYQCTCGYAFIALSPPTYCPDCGEKEFMA